MLAFCTPKFGLGFGDRRFVGSHILSGGVQGRVGLVQLDPVVFVVQDYEGIPCVYELVVLEPDLGHITGNPGNHGADVTVDLRVVGLFMALAGRCIPSR